MARTYVVAVALFCSAAKAQPLQLSQSSLTFTGYAGGDSAAPQSIIVTSTTQSPARFRVAADSSPWLSFKPSVAMTPARISVSVDPSALTPNIYPAQILITDAAAPARPIAVSVKFTVETRQPVLDVAPNSIRLNERDPVDTVFVRNVGGGGRFPFTVSVIGASTWVDSITPMQGIVGPNAPVSVRIRASSDGLDPGSYRAVLRFTSPAGSEDVPIAFFVGGPGPALRALPGGLEFDLREGASVSITKRVTIINKGTGLLNWAADLLEGSQFVKLNRASGSSTPASSSFLTVSVENDGLRAGVYYALARVSSPEARNSPALIPIVLNVRDPGIPPRPELSPAGLYFVAVAGQPPPPPQSVRIDVSSPKPVAFQASAATDDGLDWLPTNTASGVASAQRPSQISVQVNHARLQPGVYTGEGVFAFSNSEVSGVGVTLVVLPAAAKLASAKLAAGCTPARLALTQSELVSNFSIPAGWPAPLAVQLTDDCGSPVLNGQVVLTFSNGDPALAMSLSDPQDGSYSATWVPFKDGASVSITARATAPALALATTQLTGAVSSNKVPILFEDSVVNSFNAVKGAALAPGTMAAIYGSGLATAAASSGVLPLPASLNGTRVIVGGLEAPLHSVSDGQITAQIPTELAPNRQYQVLITANGAFTLPDTIALTSAQPGLQVLGDDSRVVAHHSDFTPISPSAPATPGEEIILYLVGMGQTDPAVPSGAAAPAGALSKALAQPTVTIDGKTAEILFAGLSPGSVGLYQINLRVPADARPGDLSVTISQGGAQSNTGVLPVR
jgi:uncharacterized protein (TIGR03437 family)